MVRSLLFNTKLDLQSFERILEYEYVQLWWVLAFLLLTGWLDQEDRKVWRHEQTLCQLGTCVV